MRSQSACEPSEDREEGEIVDDDFEDISDNSIITTTPCIGKSISSTDPLRALSLSSVTDAEEPPSRARKRKVRRRPSRPAVRKRRKVRRKSVVSDSDSEIDVALDRKLQMQLKVAVSVDSKESHKNSLEDRLKGMTKATVDTEEVFVKENPDHVGHDNDAEVDNELMQLRLEALQTAIYNKYKGRRKKAAENKDINKENTNSNIGEPVVETSTPEVVRNPDIVPQSPEEDEDVLRALLLASMSKKITTKIDALPQPNVVERKTISLVSKPKAVHNYKINRIRHNNAVPVIPQVKPLIINLNSSDSEDDVRPENKNSNIETSVEKFLKEQRAKVEAENASKNSTPVSTKKSPIMEKSVVKLLPKSKQIEYQKLLLKLKNAEKRPKVRRLSQRAVETNKTTTFNKSKITRNKFIKAASDSRSDALLLHNVLKEIQFMKDGRLQIQTKYNVLRPLIKRINEDIKERKRSDQEVARLLEELAEAKKKQQKMYQNVSNSIKVLADRKQRVDKGAVNGKINKPITSTPVTKIPCAIANNVCTQTDSTEKKEAEKVKYISPLEQLKRVEVCDPFAIVCPFEMDGKCKDPECTYRHLLPK